MKNSPWNTRDASVLKCDWGGIKGFQKSRLGTVRRGKILFGLYYSLIIGAPRLMCERLFCIYSVASHTRHTCSVQALSKESWFKHIVYYKHMPYVRIKALKKMKYSWNKNCHKWCVLKGIFDKSCTQQVYLKEWKTVYCIWDCVCEFCCFRCYGCCFGCRMMLLISQVKQIIINTMYLFHGKVIR